MKVAQVRIRFGDLIDSIEFVLVDGSVQTDGYSVAGGREQPTFDLDQDEHIVKIECEQEDDDPAGTLFGLQLFTSSGRISPWYGGRQGARRIFEGSEENPIIGIERGGPGGFCPKIVRVYFFNDTRAEAQAAPNATVAKVTLQPETCWTLSIDSLCLNLSGHVLRQIYVSARWISGETVHQSILNSLWPTEPSNPTDIRQRMGCKMPLSFCIKASI